MRLKSGIDIWECENCGAAVIMGRRCPVCGANYADRLQAEHRKPAKPRQKLREPAETREFTESYLFRKGQKK
jgi:predicted RNA-binding protein with PUA domain